MTEPSLSAHHAPRDGMAVGQRVQGLEREPAAEALGLPLVLGERHARQHVARRALQEDALAPVTVRTSSRSGPG